MKLTSAVIAIVLSIASFEIAIYCDGILSGALHNLIEYFFTASIFLSDNTSFVISIISSLLAHSFTVIILAYSLLYFLKLDRLLFVSFYILATVLYLAYRLSSNGEYDGTLILFVIIRLIFHTIWIPMWFYVFTQRKNNI